jgi:hypothetical protein
MESKKYFEKIRNLVASDSTADAIKSLLSFLENTPLLNEILHQSGRINNICGRYSLGLITQTEATTEENYIRYSIPELLGDIEQLDRPHQALNELLDMLEQEGSRSDLEQEVIKAISIVSSKNVVIGTISAGGNVHIGDNITYTGTKHFAPVRPLNEHLTKILVPAIQPHSIAASRFLERVINLPEWQCHTQASDKAREILAYSYVGVIGIQLGKLFAIGKEEFSENVLHKYVEKCIELARRSLDLVVFTLISQLWEEQRKQRHTFNDAQSTALANFFDRAFEPSLGDQAELLEALYCLFLEHSLPLPMPELDGFTPNFQRDSAFRTSIATLQNIENQWGKTKCAPETASDAEEALTKLLATMHFLAAWRMASIKRIGYWQIRTEAPRYLHRFAALGIDSKANVNAEKIDFTDATAFTDAILLYRGESYQTGINLSPFVIDYNALTLENGVKSCFYRANAIDGDQLEYVFLENNSPVRVTWKGLIQSDSNLNELLFDPENQKAYNLDNVISQFRDARTYILGEALSFNDL